LLCGAMLRQRRAQSRRAAMVLFHVRSRSAHVASAMPPCHRAYIYYAAFAALLLAVTPRRSENRRL